MKVCIDIGVANMKCDKCNQLFTRQGLKRHMKICQGKTFDCPECGELCSSLSNVKKHQEKEHEWETVRSREVCKHWRRGNCWKGTSCLYSHVGQQQENTLKSTSQSTTKRVPACGNGSSCDWLRKGVCSYFHPRVGVQKPWARKDGRQKTQSQDRQQGQPSRNQAQTNRQITRIPCRFDGRCEKIPNCPFIHSLQDFPVFQGRRNPAIRRGSNQRRN